MSAQTASQLLPLHALLADLVPQGSRVLDLGCGDGRMLQSLIQNKNWREAYPCGARLHRQFTSFQSSPIRAAPEASID